MENYINIPDAMASMAKAIKEYVDQQPFRTYTEEATYESMDDGYYKLELDNVKSDSKLIGIVFYGDELTTNEEKGLEVVLNCYTNNNGITKDILSTNSLGKRLLLQDGHRDNIQFFNNEVLYTKWQKDATNIYHSSTEILSTELTDIISNKIKQFTIPSLEVDETITFSCNYPFSIVYFTKTGNVLAELTMLQSGINSALIAINKLEDTILELNDKEVQS